MVSDDNKRIWMISTSLLIRDQKKKKWIFANIFISSLQIIILLYTLISDQKTLTGDL